MIKTEFFLAGFGGQGILFAGKFLAYKGLDEGWQLSWLPSYGPEMRGGTANCSVIISDHPIASPIIVVPDVLIAMNLPSFDKYEDEVKPGGMIFYDSTLIEREGKRDDIRYYPIPATKLAFDNDMKTMANMILMGKVLKVFKDYHDDQIQKTLKKIIPESKADKFEINRKAIEIGANYEG